MAGSTLVLVVGRLGQVFGSGRSAREAELDALAMARQTMASCEDFDLSAILEDLRGASPVTVSGDNAGALLAAVGLGHRRLSRPRAQRGSQREPAT